MNLISTAHSKLFEFLEYGHCIGWDSIPQDELKLIDKLRHLGAIEDGVTVQIDEAPTTVPNVVEGRNDLVQHPKGVGELGNLVAMLVLKPAVYRHVSFYHFGEA